MTVLAGIKILEFAAIGPVPWCGTLLANMGASVLRIDRPAGDGPARAGSPPGLRDGRVTVALDLKRPEDVRRALAFASRADALIEGLRPGVMERLGLGPDPCLRANPRLVYGRMTGWGQDGPLAPRAGHDINYIALSGVLHAIGPAGQAPVPPLNLVGDFGGGGAFLAMGVLAALLEARASGRGQVVDAAMVDGAATLMASVYARHAAGQWRDARGANLLDGGAPWYGVYATRDGGYMAVGAIEPAFYAQLLEGLEIAPDTLPDREDRSAWPALRARFADAFRQRTREQWCAVFDARDACVTPVLSLAEAPAHAHNAARRTFVGPPGKARPNAAPRFSATPSTLAADDASEAKRRRLAQEWGLDAAGGPTGTMPG